MSNCFKKVIFFFFAYRIPFLSFFFFLFFLCNLGCTVQYKGKKELYQIKNEGNQNWVEQKIGCEWNWGWNGI